MKRKFIYTWFFKIITNNFISANNSFNSMSLNSDGQIWAWGYNHRGQIGDNSVTDKCTPVSIHGNKKTFCQISGGQSHTVALEYNGQVWGWGYSVFGQLGNNSTLSKRTPVSILGSKKTFNIISLGQNHTIGLDKNGQIWGWGYNNFGQLGDNSITSRRTPVSIHGIKKTFCQIYSGYRFPIAIDYNGQIWTWGNNQYGQLGDNSVTSRRTPVSIHGIKKTFCQIYGTEAHSIGIDYMGQIWGWGYNGRGQLGDNSTSSRRTPVSILGTKKTFCKISGGQYHTIGIDKNGQIWTWGSNRYGQLGNSDINNKLTPVSIHGNKKTFCQIAGGTDHTIGLDKNGQIWGWGYNNYGQLGNNSITRLPRTPISISGAKKTFIRISAGGSTSMALNYNNMIWGWGLNDRGQIGNNDILQKYSPVSIMGVKKTFCEISNGINHTLGLDSTGQIWGWGYNHRGQLGNNSVVSRCTPISILGNKKTFCRISSGSYHNNCIDKNGRVWSWGNNDNGRLGDNSTTSRRTPVSILGTNKTFCQISSYSHTLSIDKNGVIWGWGDNANGKIGDNTITQRLTPVSIFGGKKTFCKIATGLNHSVSIDRNGQIWTWGFNNYGQLGDNSVTSRLTPVSILGTKKTFCQITSGDYFCVAIQHNGQIWTWGYNPNYMLGNNSTTSRRTPVSILGGKKTFCRISSGQQHTIAIEYNGQVWAWGYNLNEQTSEPNIWTPIRVCNL